MSDGGQGSLREKAVLAVAGAVVVYALTAAYWFMSAKKSWADSRKRLDRTRAAAASEEKTISERSYWDDRYEDEASQIPVVDEGKGSDTVWMRVIGDLARQNNIFVSDVKPGKEEEAGDMTQITVDVHWTAAVESLVKFMYALENTDLGKFDVKYLHFTPSRKQGYMGGTMTLACIFKRQ